ncbi:hypothetical protein TNCV_1826201 [Trichonephila clavipes]|nr:hypothetical protein TNCV_1826201 [Trichonephila clavipes]
MGTTNQHRIWGRKPCFAGENCDNEDDEPGKGSGQTIVEDTCTNENFPLFSELLHGIKTTALQNVKSGGHGSLMVKVTDSLPDHC